MMKYKQNTNNAEVGLIPPIWSIVFFLIASLLMTVSISTITSLIMSFYFSSSPEVTLVALAVVVLFFCVVNFQVVQGSFYAVKILKGLLYILLILLTPLIIIDEFYVGIFVFKLVAALAAVFSIFLLSSKQYHIFVQHRLNSVEDYKLVQAEVAAEELAKRERRL